MERIAPPTQEGSSDDESRQRDERLKLFDRLVSGEETEDGLCGFDGLSALPLARRRFEAIDDAIEKLNEAFLKTSQKRE